MRIKIFEKQKLMDKMQNNKNKVRYDSGIFYVTDDEEEKEYESLLARLAGTVIDFKLIEGYSYKDPFSGWIRSISDEETLKGNKSDEDSALSLNKDFFCKSHS